MKSLDELFDMVLAMDDAAKENLLKEKADGLVPVFEQLNDRNINGYTLFGSYIAGAMISDGKIAKEEVQKLLPIYLSIFDGKVDREDVVKMARRYESNAEDTDAYLKEMIELLASFDCTVKEDILIICIIIMSLDNEISDSEKAWIAKLA